MRFRCVIPRMLACIAAALTPPQRRIVLELCSYNNYENHGDSYKDFKLLDSAIQGQQYRQFAQSTNRALIVGTDLQYLKKLQDEYYTYSQFSEVKIMLISTPIYMGDLYDAFKELIQQQQFYFIIFPVGACNKQQLSLKYLYSNDQELAGVYPTQQMSGAFSRTLMDALAISRGYECSMSASGSFCFTTQRLKQVTLLTTPYFHFIDGYAEAIVACPVTHSGMKMVDNNCLISVQDRKLRYFNQHQNDIGSSLIQATNFVSTLYQLHKDIPTNKIQRLIVQAVKLMRSSLIDAASYNLFQLGYGYGLISQRALGQFLQNLTKNQQMGSETGRVYSLLFANLSNFDIVDIRSVMPDNLSSFESQKVGVVLRNVRSDPYDSHQSHTLSNITNEQLRMLKGFKVYVVDVMSRRIMKIGTIKDDNHVFFVSDTNVNNILALRLQIVITNQTIVTGNLTRLRYDPLPLDLKMLLLFSGYHVHFSIVIINAQASESVIYFTVGQQNPGKIKMFYQCQTTKSLVVPLEAEMVNDMYKAINPKHEGFCKIMVCYADVPVSQVMYMNNRCGLSEKLRVSQKSLLKSWAFGFGIFMLLLATTNAIYFQASPQTVRWLRSA